jgi:hypothetical protein
VCWFAFRVEESEKASRPFYIYSYSGLQVVSVAGRTMVAMVEQPKRYEMTKFDIMLVAD